VPEQVNNKTKILVVDDEPNIVELLSTALRFEQFDVIQAFGSNDALKALEANPEIDLAILDVMLPGINGFDLADLIKRVKPEIAIVYLTARDATEDKILGFKAGADDYITKPFSLEELTARLNAVLRRSSAYSRSRDLKLTYHDLVLDQDTYEVFRSGNLIELTPTEFALLRQLMLHPRKVFTKAQLLELVWQVDFDGDPNLVETYISYLRKKIDVFEPPLIQTVRGIGYSLRMPG
jgi:two-component system OmpR family response regulator